MARIRTLCPRCQEDYYTPYGADWQKGDPSRPALSRTGAGSICSACGRHKALLDAADEPLPPYDQWPVSRNES